MNTAAASRDRKSRFEESPFSLCDLEVSGTYLYIDAIFCHLIFFRSVKPSTTAIIIYYNIYELVCVIIIYGRYL